MLLSLFGWKYEGWEQIMDWVVVASVISAVVLLLIEIIKSVRDTKALSKEHEGLSKEHERISDDFRQQIAWSRKQVEKDHGEIRRENAHLAQMVSSLVEDSIKKQEREKYLTSTQIDIKESLNVLQGMERQMETLQMESVRLREEKLELNRRLDEAKQEIGELKAENRELYAKLRSKNQEYDEPSL